MRVLITALLALSFIAGSTAQTLTTRDAAHKADYLVRMIQVSSHLDGGVRAVKFCLFVAPDGRFRMESSDPILGSSAKPKVYLSSFTPDVLQALHALLEDDQLKELHTPDMRPTAGRDLDMFAAAIARGTHVQDLNAVKDDSHNKINPSLQNLENWMIGVSKQKWPQDKSAVANTCKAL